MAYRLGFFMSQVAGHITNYRNLRQVTDSDVDITANWHEISYFRDGGAIEKLHQKFFRFVPSYFPGIARASSDMWRALQKAPYDAVLVNDNVAIFFGSALRAVPMLIDFDVTPLQIDAMPAYGSPNDPKPVANLKYQLWRNHMHRSTLMQAWSNWARRSAIEDYGMPPERVVVNPPGVDLDRWRPAPEQYSQAAAQPLRVLFVGGDFERKGGHLLLEWFHNLANRQIELHIVTREPVEPAPGISVYRNMQPNTPELMQLYYQSDLFVLPSLGECFGIATVEAMATGLPVIASDVGGTADIIEPERNGYIVKAGDVKALGEAIMAILEYPERRKRMGVQSRQLAEERFDMQRNARQTLNYLKQIADERKGALRSATV
jgi:glycosyltransferase involved in cell wall biosynthesis